MRIAILYICTGKYNQFFEGFYVSAMKLFLTDHEKTFFVWTDDDHIADGLDNVHVIHKECAGFPADSLFRFEMYLQAEEELKKFDYIYFIQANAKFLQPVGEEILPNESGLAMGIWGGVMLKRPACLYPYERNKKSLAYVAPYGKDYVYYMGGINGGRSKEYLAMARTLAANIRDDYNRGIIAEVHDQSHINAYMRTHACKIITPEYCWPEEVTPEFPPKMIFRDKVKIDPYFNKGRKFTLEARFKKGSRMLWNVVRWYLKF
ncbi:MAG: glycosyl transferase family 6 [Clostridium sp.]|nr:glycosyl transferase family 6 [Clostridium sp.]